MREKTKGRKRHIVVDIMEKLLSVIHAADIHDTKSDIFVAKQVIQKYPFNKSFCAEAAYFNRFEK